MSKNQKIGGARYIGLALGVIASLMPIFSLASVFPIVGTITKTGSTSFFSGSINFGELASAASGAPLSVLGFMTAGDILIALLLFGLTMLNLLTIFLRKI